jgi:hypothetical protein
MTWFEDDSHTIPDYIKNMPREELDRRIEEYEEELRKERARRLKLKLESA